MFKNLPNLEDLKDIELDINAILEDLDISPLYENKVELNDNKPEENNNL